MLQCLAYLKDCLLKGNAFTGLSKEYIAWTEKYFVAIVSGMPTN